MAAGDVLNSKRPRFETNERFDVVDADAQSEAPRNLLDAFARAAFSTPLCTATFPVGMIFTGGTITGVAANAVVSSDLLVAFDSDGRLLIKPSGTALSIAIPGGGARYQVYLYFKDDDTDDARRRFIPVTTPFTEFMDIIKTTYSANVGLFVRAGDFNTTVPSDVVDGVTKPLVFLTIANNPAGNAIIIGQDATHPFGQYTTNILTTVTVPASVPVNNVDLGSIRTLQDFVIAAFHAIARDRWLGSNNNWYAPDVVNGPLAATNFGAYTETPKGLAYAVRGLTGVRTLGDGATQYGQYDSTMYANDRLMLQAAIDALPASGGTIYLQNDAHFSNFDGVSILIPANKDVTIVGLRSHSTGATPMLSMGANQKFTFSDPGAGVTNGLFKLQGLRIDCTNTLIEYTNNPITIEDCVITRKTIGGTPQGTSAVILASAANDFTRNMRLLNSKFYATVAVANFATYAFFYSNSGPISDVLVEDCSFEMSTHAQTFIYMYNICENVRFINCDFYFNGTEVILDPADQPIFLCLEGVDNVDKIQGRLISGCSFRGANTTVAADCNMVALYLRHVSFQKIVDCSFVNCIYGVHASDAGVMVTTNLIISCCDFYSDGAGAGGYYPGMHLAGLAGISAGLIESCRITGVSLFVNGTTSLAKFSVVDCTFVDCPRIDLLGQGVSDVTVTGCSFETVPADEMLPLHIGGSSCTNCVGVRVCNNTFKGYAKAAPSTIPGYVYFALKLSSVLLTDVVITGNTFRDLQNVTHSAVVSASHAWSFVISVCATTLSKVVVSDNTCSNCNNVAVGANQCVIYWLGVASFTGIAGDCAIDQLSIHGNNVGDIVSHMGGARLGARSIVGVDGHVTASNVQVTDNVFTFLATNVGLLLWAYHVWIELSTSEHHSIQIADNQFKVKNTSGSALLRDSVSIQDLVGGAIIRFLTVTGNVWIMDQHGWDGSAAGARAGFEVATLMVINVLIFNNNCAVTESDPTVVHFFTRFDITVNNAYQAVPAGGGASAWTGNLLISEDNP